MPPDGSMSLPYVVEVGQPSPAYDAFREFTPASTPPIYVEHATRRVLSLEPEGDRFFGLLPGTNGTGPTMRRACAPDGYTWLTSDCKTARGPLLVPSETSDEQNTNPWSGKP